MLSNKKKNDKRGKNIELKSTYCKGKTIVYSLLLMDFQWS